MSGTLLADTLYAWFHNHPQVHFGDDQRNVALSHRKYVAFGSNLLGFTHGDGAKEKDLPQIMQYEARKAWGVARHATWYVHHTHHKDRKAYSVGAGKLLEKDHVGVTVIGANRVADPSKNVYVETVRSPSPEDSWHDRIGYLNRQAIEAFLHCPEKGPIARLTHPF